jgi:hypothetical protein
LLLGNVHCGKQFTGYLPITVTRRWLCRGRCRSVSVIILQRRQATTGRAHSSLGSLALTRSIAPISYACGSNLLPIPVIHAEPCLEAALLPASSPIIAQCHSCHSMVSASFVFVISHRESCLATRQATSPDILFLGANTLQYQPSIHIHLHSVPFLTPLYHTVISLAPTSRIAVPSQ